MKAFFKKITAFTWAFILLLTVFFTVGICTLGDARTTGESLVLQRGQTAYYSLTTKTGEKLDAVYVKADNFYVAAQEEVMITINTASSSSPAESSWSSTNTLTKTIVSANRGYAVLGATAQNWIAIGKKINRSVQTLSITTDARLIINEIVCLNQNGEIIPIKGYKPTYSTIPVAELAPAYDAQDSFTASENAYYNFTAEESYYLNAVKNLLSGRKYVEDSKYATDGNFNYLATVLFAPSVAMFGASVFSMRLPAFLATCVLLVFAYLLVRELTKSEKYAFMFAVLLCLGGMVTTVGRLGAPYAFIASALVASGYFMYKFFAKGISSKRVVKDGLNILYSGIFAAVALAIDIASVFPVAAILVLFGFGMRRQKRAYEIELKKTEGKEEQITKENGETVTVNKAARAVQVKYAEKQRISLGFAALSFVIATFALILVAAVLCYLAAVRANGNKDAGLFFNVWNGLFGSLRSGAAVPFGEANQSSVWAWFLPVKATTLYTGVNVLGAGEYLTWSALPNLALSALSLAAVLGVTVKVAFDIAKGNQDKKALRLRRTYFLLVCGLAAAMLGGCVKLYVTPVYSLLFHVLYTAFLPLAATLIPETDGMSVAKKVLIETAQWAVIGVCAVCFALCVPATYGVLISESYAPVFGWMSFLNNGYFR